MHLSGRSARIYDFALANGVNANKIIIFFTTKLGSFKAPMKALIGFHRYYICSADSPICSELKSIHTILMRQLQANSWKYHVFEDDGLFTPCHSDMQGTEGVKLPCPVADPEICQRGETDDLQNLRPRVVAIFF